MRLIALVLALTLGTFEVRADLITYHMESFSVQPDSLSVSKAPEPGSLTLLVLGLLGLVARRVYSDNDGNRRTELDIDKEKHRI